jgi:hypothetical protein
METSDGVYEWVTLKSEKPIPPTVIPELKFEEAPHSHKQNELGDEEHDDDD